MKLVYVIILTLSFSAQALESNIHHLFEGKLAITLPTDLKSLSKLGLNKRYGKQTTPPAYAFSNKDQNVSFTFTQYSTPAEASSMKRIHKSISDMLRQANEKAKWKKDKVYNRFDTKVAVYEYETIAVGKYQYNLTYALPVNGKLTFISFITTEKKYKTKWVSLARESLDSINLASL